LAQATIRFQDRKYNLDHELRQTALVTDSGQKGLLRWEDFAASAIDPQTVGHTPAPAARFESLPPSLAKSQDLKSLRADFLEWAYRNTALQLKSNQTLQVYAAPDMSAEAFVDICCQTADIAKEADIDKVEATFEKKLDALEEKLDRAQDKLAAEESDYSARKQEELVKHAETFFGLFTKRRRSISSSMTKRRLTSQAQTDVEEAKEDIEELEADIAALQSEMEQALQEVEKK